MGMVLKKNMKKIFVSLNVNINFLKYIKKTLIYSGLCNIEYLIHKRQKLKKLKYTLYIFAQVQIKKLVLLITPKNKLQLKLEL